MSTTVNQSFSVQQTTSWPAVILIWLSGVSAAMQFSKFSISFNQLLDFYQVSPTLGGVSLSIVGVVGLILGVTGGIVANKIGYFKVLIGALLLGAILSFVQSLLPSFEWILVTRLLEGFSQLGVVVAGPTIIALLSAQKHKSITMGLWGTFFGVAFAISGGLGNNIMNQYGMSGLYMSHSVLILAMALALMVVLDRDESRYRSALPKSQESYFKKLVTIYRNPRSLMPALVFLFYTSTLVSLLTYIPGFIENKETRSTMQVVLPLVSTFGTFLAGAIAQYWLTPQRVAQVAYVGLGLGATLLTLFSSNQILLCMIFGLMVLSAGLIPGAALSMIPKLARDPYEQGNGYGLIAQLGNLGATIGPPLYASMIASFGITGLISVVWAVFACGLSASLLAARIK